MTQYIANARMYSVAPEAESAWRELLTHVCTAAEVDFRYVEYRAPQPLELLWRRADVGAVQMCGYPIATRLAPVVPIAAPIAAVPWAQGRAVYRSHLIVRAEAPYERLEDTFGGSLGWTVAHSHSGFNALRHHLLGYRTPERPTLYDRVVGDLVTARRVIDAVIGGEIDVGPLDAYWHHLLLRHQPVLARRVRILDATDLAPMPAFVASPALPIAAVARLKASFADAHRAPWFARCAEPLLLQAFAPVEHGDFRRMLDWEADAIAAGYPLPA
jgi:ABC-type phosphate/phosphonate transport system substrate-binding protein